MTPSKNTSNCGSQNGKAKSQVVAQIVRIVRKAGLDYEGWRYVSQEGQAGLRPAHRQEGTEAAPCADRR